MTLTKYRKNKGKFYAIKLIAVKTNSFIKLLFCYGFCICNLLLIALSKALGEKFNSRTYSIRKFIQQPIFCFLINVIKKTTT